MKTYLGIYLILAGVGTLFFASNDARLLNYVILGLYLTAMLWWGLHHSPWDVAYWFFAFGITFVVTFGYLRKL